MVGLLLANQRTPPQADGVWNRICYRKEWCSNGIMFLLHTDRIELVSVPEKLLAAGERER